MALSPATPHHTVVTGTGYDKDGTEVSYEMYEAEFAVRKGHTFQRHYNCVICRFTYPRNEVVLRRGKAFCIPRGHYKEREYTQVSSPVED